MVEKLEFEGDWKVSSKNEWLHGTLTFDPEKGGYLSVFGSFQDDILPFRPGKIDMVNGRTPLGLFTLGGLGYRSFKTDRISGVRTSYDVDFIFSGIHFNDKDEIKFSQVTFSLFNLDSWFNPNNIDVEHNLEKWSFELKAEYQSIKNVSFGKNISIDIDHDVALRREENPKGYSIIKSSQIIFNYPEPMIWMDMWKDIICFKDLISFCTNEQSYPTNITLNDPRFEESFGRTTRQIPINLYFNTTSFHRGSKHNDFQDHLVPFSTLEHKLEEVLTTWYQIYEKYRIPINLVNDRLKSKRSFNETKFLDAARAVEVFHRIGSNKTKFSPDHFNRLKLTAVEAFSEKADRTWMKNILSYANELSLRQRLKDLINEYELNFLFDDKTPIAKFVNRVVVTRNYFTHYDEQGKRGAAHSSDLINLTRMLSALFYCCLLKDLSIDQSDYRKQIKDRLHQF